MEEGAGAMALWQFMNEMALDNIVLEGAFLLGPRCSVINPSAGGSHFGAWGRMRKGIWTVKLGCAALLFVSSHRNIT